MAEFSEEYFDEFTREERFGRAHTIDEFAATDFGSTSSILDGHRAVPAGAVSEKTALAASVETLKTYGTDITEKARKGKIGEVIGRESEIRQLMGVAAGSPE